MIAMLVQHKPRMLRRARRRQRHCSGGQVSWRVVMSFTCLPVIKPGVIGLLCPWLEILRADSVGNPCPFSRCDFTDELSIQSPDSREYRLYLFEPVR